MYYTTAKTFASRGHSMKFASIEHAFKRARKLLSEHPQLREYHLFADKLRDPGESGRIRTLKNPSGFQKATAGLTKEMDDAAQRFENFTGHRATHVTRYKKSRMGPAFALGNLLAVEYRATRDGVSDRYRHDFRKSSQPLLVSDGSQLDIVGGRIRVTNRGIEDL